MGPLLVLTLLVSALGTWLWLGLGRRAGWLDRPGALKAHVRPIPTAGGMGIVVAFLSGLWLVWAVRPAAETPSLRHILGLTLAGLVIGALGMVDDLRGCSAWEKLPVQILAALVLYAFDFDIPRVTNPFGDAVSLDALALPITVLWIVGVTNAVNLVDGADGLAAGVVGIAVLSLAVIAFHHGERSVVVVAALLAASVAGFLPFNLPPARIFLGDTGSLFLGLAMAAASLLENQRKGTVAVTLLLPVVLMAIPIVDTALAVFRRLVEGRHPFQGDMEHLHHRLLRVGLGPWGVLGVFYTFSGVLGVAAYLLSVLPKEYVMVLTLALGAALHVAVLTLRMIERRRARAPAVRSGAVPGRGGGGPDRLIVLLLAGLVAGLPGPATAEPPAPPGIWGVDGYPELLSIHAQNGLAVAIRLRGVGVGSPGAPWEFAIGSVLPDGTGFVAPLVDPATFQDSGKQLSLVFKPTNPSRLLGKVIDGATGAVDLQFNATKIFPVSGYDVLAFGDSITAGAGAQSSGGYPEVLENLLGPAFGVVNAGVGGETVFTGATRLPATLDASTIVPGIVLILEGINGLDADAGSIESTLGALLDMVAAVRARGGLPILGTLTPVKPPDTREPAVEALNARIRQVAAEQGIRLADHHAAFGGNPGLLGAGGLHPNDQGYQVMAETWLAAILAAW